MTALHIVLLATVALALVVTVIAGAAILWSTRQASLWLTDVESARRREARMPRYVRILGRLP